jgi:hypothetical protein
MATVNVRVACILMALLLAASAVSAQGIPRGVAAACDGARYQALRSMQATERTAAETLEYRDLDWACSQELALYYRLRSLNVPPGGAPACEEARYRNLLAVHPANRTPAEAEELGEREEACQRTLATYMDRRPGTGILPTSRGVAAIDHRREREPAEALVWSLLVPGGGQVYNGDYGKGVLFFGANVAGWTGLYLLPWDDHLPLRRGLLVGLIVGSYWGSLFDAVRSAR